ncbi:MAG: hypothetical protein ACM3NE_08385 [Hyphomicrobiales bacterium]|jgi:glycosidase
MPRVLAARLFAVTVLLLVASLARAGNDDDGRIDRAQFFDMQDRPALPGVGFVWRRPAAPFESAYAPLDTTNPDVRRYPIDTYIAPALQRGYDAIALDTVSLVNNVGRCGVGRDGLWTQLYSGESRDPRHT